MLSSDFHCKENDGFRVVPVHPELVTSDYGVHEVEVTLWSPACLVSTGCTGEIRYQSFSYNENPKRTLNTTPLKCCLPLNDAIERRKKFTHAYEGSILLHASALH